jgi:murein DD-endopeptidase MepM/ murein hydrolase activator NlpD
LKLFLILFSITLSLFASQVQNYRWQSGESYLMFLQRLHLPHKHLYYDLDKDDKRLTQEIRTGINYQLLTNDEDITLQALIPLNNELQIHIYKKNKIYKFEIIPIISTTKTLGFSLKIQHSPYYDIMKATKSNKLAEIFVSSFKYSLSFKTGLSKGDSLVMIFDQKYRHGHPFSMPILKVAMIELHKKKNYIYLNTDGRYYNENMNEVEGFLLALPVKYRRISSHFTRRRYHPILEKWKAHLGIDYVARCGTPIVATNNGRIIYSAWMGSYGKVVKIRHIDGYETRYAHMKSIRRGIRRGTYVKKGQVIGYVGSTGRSTGPHLHFELRKHGRAINPLTSVRVSTNELKGSERIKFLKLKSNYDESLNFHLKNNTKYSIQPKLQRSCYFDNKT